MLRIDDDPTSAHRAPARSRGSLWLYRSRQGGGWPTVTWQRNRAGSRPRRALALWLWFACAAFAWLLVTVIAHHLFHRYEPQILIVTAGFAVKFLVMTLALTTTVWLMLLSLPVRRPGLRGTALILLWSTLIVLCALLSHAEMRFLRTEMVDLSNPRGLMAVTLMALAYAIALAIPFVPGVEIGLMMMVLFGATGAISAWLATVASLSIAFAVGHHLPYATTSRWLAHVGVHVGARGEADPEAAMARSQPRGAARVAWLLGHRYLLLAAMLNFPGNSLVGGGGGLALMCGMSRLYDPGKYLITVVLATLPVPLLFLLGVVHLDSTTLPSPGHFHELLSWLETALLPAQWHSP